MSTMEAAFLGLLQGLTEFLPVSSSAHLVAAQELLDVKSPGIRLEVALHLGTLAAILIVFRRELLQLVRDGIVGAYSYLRGARGSAILRQSPMFPTAVAVVAGTIPAVLAGLAFGKAIEGAFDTLWGCGALLVLTGAILIASRFAPKPTADRVGPGRGFAVGIVQAAALLPGISRSGSTIVAGYFLGLRREVAARFSFLLAVPALLGAGAWKLARGLSDGAAHGSAAPAEALSGSATAAGVAVAAVVGTACLVALIRLINRGRLHWFAAYCIPAGMLMVLADLLNLGTS